MTNKTALYVLLAALLLAVLTNRWFLHGSTPGFNIVSFDGLFFAAQWIAFAMTSGVLVLLATQWHASRQFPKLILPGAAMLFCFVATGIPQTLNAQEWASGNLGLLRWWGAFQAQRQASEVAPRFSGAWKSGIRIYTFKRDELTIAAAGITETVNAASCGNALTYGYATEAVFRSNPAAEPYYRMLGGPPVPMLDAGCPGRLYTFLLLPDNTLIAFRDLHELDPQIETLTRVP